MVTQLETTYISQPSFQLGMASAGLWDANSRSSPMLKKKSSHMSSSSCLSFFHELEHGLSINHGDKEYTQGDGGS